MLTSSDPFTKGDGSPPKWVGLDELDQEDPDSGCCQSTSRSCQLQVAEVEEGEERSCNGWMLWALVYIGLVDRDNNSVEEGGSGNGYHGIYYLATPFSFLFALADIVDFALDVNLSVKLIRRPEYTWGVLLLVASILSQCLLYRSRYLRSFNEGLAPINTTVYAAFQLVVFMLEDHTTIVAYTQVYVQTMTRRTLF